jgi:putative flippase GtrA
MVVTPLSFVLNKVWTFAAVRTHHLEAVPPHPVAEADLEALGVGEGAGEGGADEAGPV